MKTRISILLAVVAALASGVLSAQENEHGWVKYEGNPVFGGPETGTMFDAQVTTHGKAKFNMYVSWRPKKAIALTHSDDGINWSEPVVVLRNDETSGWEDDINRTCTIFWNGQYHMWYTGQARNYSKIGYAVSDDGVNFRRVTKMPVLIPERPHEGYSVMNPYVIRDEERGVFRMWYACGETYEPNVLCYAESTDGIHWEKSPLNPIFVHGWEEWEQNRIGACEVHQMGDGTYAMFYIGYKDIHTAHIGVAFSKDGVTGWERYDNNPIVAPYEGTWDSNSCYKPSVYRDVENNKWHLWYNGRSAGYEYIGYVVHEGLDITK
jgi:predicted GH43/DUF377 family glycosyl hydrolase